MVAPARSSDVTRQIVAQCRARPLVYDDVRPELCVALEQVILARMQADRGRKIGSLNVGGWKSSEDFFSWPDAAVQEFRATIVEMVGAWSPVAWTMVNRAGSHHPRHQHPIATLVGIYYVTTGNPATPTIFECGGSELEVEPHPGRLVLSPGSMWHRVPRYAGDAPRITIAFDVRR